MKRTVKKRGFPFGIFFLLLFSLLLLGSVITASYFYFGLKNEISKAEETTRRYSVTLAEAFTDVAELSYRYGNYSRLTSLFREKIQENSIDEAFFVLGNGRIVVHSNRDVERELRGNIGNDEFSYNIEMIMLPLRKRERNIMFREYNILGKRIPFNRAEKKIIRKYFYKNIFVNGWLVTKAVFVKKRRKEVPVGTVNFIIGKNKIYALIARYRKEGVFIAAVLGGASVFIALLVSFFVFVRYRRLYRMIHAQGIGETGAMADVDVIPVDTEEAAGIPETDIVRQENELAENAGEGAAREEPFAPDITFQEEIHFDVQKTIKDAIPVKKRKRG